MRNTQDTRADGLPGESATMKVPPRNRWQVLLVEYELLDASISQVTSRVWSSGLFLIGMSMLGISFLAATLPAGAAATLNLIVLLGGVASLLTMGWWLLLRRMFASQRVAEYRRDEIERELSMRTGLYLTALRQNRRFEARRAASMARQMAEGDEELEDGLRQFTASPEGRPWFPRIMAERLVWSLVPWLLIAAWGWLFVLKYPLERMMS